METKEIVLLVQMRIKGTENEIKRERAKIAALSADEEIKAMYMKQVGGDEI